MTEPERISISIGGILSEEELQELQSEEGIIIFQESHMYGGEALTEILATVSVISSAAIAAITKVVIAKINAKKDISYKDKDLEISGISEEKLLEVLNRIKDKK